MSDEKQETYADISAELRDLSRSEKLSIGAKYCEPQPMVGGKPIGIYFAELADRIEAAIERDRTSRRSIKIPIEIKPTLESHRALATWILLAEWLIKNAGKDALGQGIAEIVPQLRARIDESRAVLAKPLRNCNRFHDWDSAEAEYQKLVEEGKVEDGTWCEWLFAPATEGGAR